MTPKKTLVGCVCAILLVVLASCASPADGEIDADDSALTFTLPFFATVNPEWISVDSSERHAATGVQPAINGDGRYVAFSTSEQIDALDDDLHWDVFRRDRSNGTTSITSVDSAGEQSLDGNAASPSMSDSGRYVAFESNDERLSSSSIQHVFVKNAVTGALTRISCFQIPVLPPLSSTRCGNAKSGGAAISASGRYVAFTSYATNFVTTYTGPQVYIKDRDSDGDGIFDESFATTLSLVSVRPSGETQHDTVTGGDYQFPIPVDISGDGRYVAFQSFDNQLVADDTNGTFDIFVRDTATNATVLVSRATDGSVGTLGSLWPTISSTGRFVAFVSAAPNFGGGGSSPTPQVFLRDRDTDVDGVFDEPAAVSTILVSRTPAGLRSNEWSFTPEISGSGRYIVFDSEASDLFAADTDSGLSDVFVFDRITQTVRLVNATLSGTPGAGAAENARISTDGHYIVWMGRDDDILFPGIVPDGYQDVYSVDNPFWR